MMVQESSKVRDCLSLASSNRAYSLVAYNSHQVPFASRGNQSRKLENKLLQHFMVTNKSMFTSTAFYICQNLIPIETM